MAAAQVVGLLGMGAALRRGMSGLLYERVVWTHLQAGAVASRTELTGLDALGSRDRRAFLEVPEFAGGQVRVTIHPDDRVPPPGSTADHPRFGTLTVLAWGPADRTGFRQGAATWS